MVASLLIVKCGVPTCDEGDAVYCWGMSMLTMFSELGRKAHAAVVIDD